MPLKLMYITNDANIAKIADKCGVDWIFVDLETKGKLERQGHLDTVISNHEITDISKLKRNINKAKLLVRINPFNLESENEINSVISEGADIVMLPYFKFLKEVKLFLKCVNRRAKTCLLLETPEAVEILDDILNLKGIDYIHIGLNDLHLGYHMNFMFEPLANGIVDKICLKIKKKNVNYGFGGIAQIGQGYLPAEIILSEHYRLGSSMVILSRSFLNQKNIRNYEEAEKALSVGIRKLRNEEEYFTRVNIHEFQKNRKILKNRVHEIVNDLKGKK